MRHTALKAHADLDVIVVLHWTEHIKGKRPSEILQAVRDSLAGYATQVRKNGQAVTLYYKSWPNVDVVPVSKATNADGTVDHYDVPDTNTETWLTSRPRRHSKAILDAATLCGPMFLPLVRMVKEWNRVHSDLMSSYHIEVLALRVFSATITDYPWAVYQYFDRAAKLAASRLSYEGGYADDYLDAPTRKDVVARLQTARERSGDAWYQTYGERDDHKKAIEIWRSVFGGRFPAYG